MTIEKEIAKRKTVSFSEYQELALYSPEYGFYERGGKAGRDFLTSVELGPLFSKVLARAIDRWWHELGEPPEFHFFEVAASSGKLAKDVLQQEMQCRNALRYIGVERSSVLRQQWQANCEVVAELPSDMRGSIGVVFCNELFDNIPTDIYDDRDELRVKAVGGKLQWHRRVVGQMFPEQQRCARWLDSALKTFSTGRLIAIDYMRTTAEMREQKPDAWLRGYNNQQRVGIFESPGECDITCDVALDQLRWVRTPRLTLNQAQFLQLHGINAIAAASRSEWEANAAEGNLAAMRARALLNEVEALTDPAGLGGFTVLEWNCGQ